MENRIVWKGIQIKTGLFLLTFIGLVVVITFLYTKNECCTNVPRHYSHFGQKGTELPVNVSKSKTFAYLTMTESCIPEYLLEDVALGIPSDRDVFVLSYRGECKSISVPAHVTHIFRPGTTWTTGRNELFYYVKGLKRRYQYHIYLDDDVFLYYTAYLEEYSAKVNLKMATDELKNKFIDTKEHEKAIRELRNNLSTWQFFEKSILEHSPAFAVANLGHAETRLMAKERWKSVCPPNTEMPWVTPTFFIDTNLIAFHEEALPMLMPHCKIGDHISWYLSAVYLVQRAKALFYRQCIGIWGVSVLNTKGRPYPRNPFPDNYLDIYWNTEDGKKIRDLIDIRERDFVMFYRDNGKWKDVYLGDRGMCTEPLKFPVSKHYRVSHT